MWTFNILFRPRITGQGGFFMSRVALSIKTSITTAIVATLVVGGAAVGIWSHNASPKAQITTQQSQTTDVKYKGVEGKNALDLLKKYAKVETKHYSFGDLVTSINGTQGNGPKYWSFYLNGKMSDVGAGAYTTHSGDSIEWKLQ
jgi:hypothetical protein